MRRHRITRQLGAAILAICVLAQLVLAQEQRMSRADARTYASDLIDQGQPRAAREIALGLLAVDPADVTALILLARAESALGQQDLAHKAGRLAWQVATNPTEKFAAAVTMAQLNSAQDRLTTAQIWLRRAAQVAPSDEARSYAARDYATLRNRNPLSVQVGLGAAPSSNINNGSSNSTTTFEGLPFVFTLSADALPLSGTELSAEFALRYTLTQSETSATFVELGVFGRSFILSQDAKTAVPEASGSDYAFSQATLGLTHRWVPEGSRDPYTLGVTFGHSWFSDAPLTRTTALQFGRSLTLSDADQLSLRSSLEKTTYQTDGDKTLSYQIHADWSHKLGNSDVISAGLGAVRTTSDAIDRSFDAASLRLGYDFGTVFPGVDLSTQISYETRSYDSAFFGSDLRVDARTSLGVTVGLTEVQLLGFQPVFTAQASKNVSNVDLYETETFQLGLSIRSAF